MSYDPNFISGHTIQLPRLGPSLVPLAFNAGSPIDHTKFSIIFHQARKLAMVCASNLDGASMIPAGVISRKGFVFDPDVPKHIQIDNNQGYRNNPWDRGHLVRRRALHWGEPASATLADRESSYWTNIAPQHEHLHDTAWGEIEDWLLDLADQGNKRLSVFVGPIMFAHDPVIVNRAGEEPTQIPAGYWKIVVLKHNDELKAAAFLTWQRDHDKAVPVDFDPILEQVRITTIEYLTGLTFPELHAADPMRFAAQFETTAFETTTGPSMQGILSAQPTATAIARAQDLFL